MITSTSAFGKASAAGSPRAASQIRRLSTNPGRANRNGNRHGHANGKPDRIEDPFTTQRELFVDILSANATKRDAKQFLARFKTPKVSGNTSEPSKGQTARNDRQRSAQNRLDRMGVNLGSLYGPGRAIAETPQFTRQENPDEKAAPRQIMSTALVCLRDPQNLEDEILDGLALTLSQMVKLGMRLVLVLDSADSRYQQAKASPPDTQALKVQFEEQADRICQALELHNPAAARYVDGALETTTSQHPSALTVATPSLLYGPLHRGMIPVVPLLAYTPTGLLVEPKLTAVMEALTVELSNDPAAKCKPMDATHATVDRIIVLDEAGGIPSKARGDGSHVFINLEQEFSPILEELSDYDADAQNAGLDATAFRRHQNNLRLVQSCLNLLPSSSSALLISPQEAAASSSLDRSLNSSSTGTGTRRQKNTLIHNLLTNKSMISSSLPVARLPDLTTTSTDESMSPVSHTSTLVKRGMPVEIFPPPSRGSRWEESGWKYPENGVTSLQLEDDPSIDFPRLVYLIENSFRRELNVEHYLNRIRGKIAGIIVAGNYEGGAILTWEQPPGTSDPSRLVPYLDKFAVLQSSQGSSGVADILFQAMVRSCFPNGVCWRSRKDNPVNKWYFERATASWKIPDTNWTMFWTGEGIVENEARFEDYAEVCKNVEPSFHGKKPE